MQTIFSNCAGKAGCNCGTSFSNCSGCGLHYSNAGGEPIATLDAKGININPVTLQTFTTLPGQQNTSAQSPTSTPRKGEKVLNTVSDVLSLAGGLFGKKTSASVSTDNTPPPPVDEKKVPTMVWVALGVLVVLVAVFFISKASSK